MRFALPILKLASAVHIVTVEDQKETPFPSMTASEYLSRQGISSDLHSQDDLPRAVVPSLGEAWQESQASPRVGSGVHVQMCGSASPRVTGLQNSQRFSRAARAPDRHGAR
jgi:hypothetical protein